MPSFRDHRTDEEQERDRTCERLLSMLLPSTATAETRIDLEDRLTEYVRAMIELVKAEDRQREADARDY